MRKSFRRLRSLIRATAAVWRNERKRLLGRSTRRRAQPPLGLWIPSIFDRLEPRVHLASTAAQQLIGLTEFRKDPRFAGINGAGMDIVIIDNTFDTSHSDFRNALGASRIVFQQDFANGDANAHNTAGSHGTHVASIAAGKDYGIAPGANLILFKSASDASLALNGNAGLTNAAIGAALTWVQNNGLTGGRNVVAVNMSFGGNQQYTVQNATNDALATYAAQLTAIGNAQQIYLSGAAGNEFVDGNMIGNPSPGAAGIESPAIHTLVGSAGAVYSVTRNSRFTDRGDHLNADQVHFGWDAHMPGTKPDMVTTFSNRMPGITDLFAPGAAITAALPNTDPADPNPTGKKSGTSMAAPAISGVIALIQQLATLRLGAKLPVNSPTNPRDLLSMLQFTGKSITDIYTNATVEHPQAPVVAPAPLNGTGGIYDRVNILRAGEKILEWAEEGSGTVYLSNAVVEFNQFGVYEGIFNATSASSRDVLRLEVPSEAGYTVKAGRGSLVAADIPPMIVIQRAGQNTMELVRAPHNPEPVSMTFAPGSYNIALKAQAAPQGTYQSNYTIRGPVPSVADFSELSDNNGTAELTAARRAEYFTFIPRSPHGSITVSGALGNVDPVVSIYDDFGKLVQRVEGTSAAGATVNFTNLGIRTRYVVRVGAKQAGQTGLLDLNVGYSARNGSGPAPATGSLSAGMIAALRAGIESIGRLGDRLDGHGEMSRKLPMLDKTQGELADLGGALASVLVAPLQAALNGGMTVEQVKTLLRGLSVSAGGLTISTAPGSVAAFQEDGQVKFAFTLEGVRRTPTLLNLAGVSGTEQIKIGDDLTPDVLSTIHLDVELGAKLDDALAAAERVSLKFNHFKVESQLDEQSLDARLTQGVSRALVTDGHLLLKAGLVTNIASGGNPEMSAASIDGAQLADIVTNTPTSSLSGSWPLDVTVGSFSKTDASLQFVDSNLYDESASVQKMNWGELDFFDNISANDLLQLIRSIKDKVQALASLPAINTPIPFADGKSVSELLGLAKLLDEVNGVLSDAEGAVNFVDSDQLLESVADLLDIPAISQNYNPSNHQLSFLFNFDKALSGALPFRIDVHNSVLDMTAAADLGVSGRVKFRLGFGIDLTPPGAGITLADRFFIEKGRLDADIALNVTNVAGSAELFDFLGISLSGGSGTASAALGVDFFAGEHVTLADIGRSIANAGAAVSGADPVPAALANLHYTGTGNITLPNISLSGLAFTPTGAPQLKINLPDFKTPSVLNVDTSQLGELLSFQELSFDDLLNAIRQFVNNLKDNAVGSFLRRDIPGTGKSIGDLVDFIDRLATAVQELQDGDAGTLQEAAAKIESKLETALGLSGSALTNVLSIARDATTSKPMVSMQLNSTGSSSGSFGFDLDVDELLGSGSLAGFPALASSLIDASASGTVTYSGGFDLNLGFGVYLDTPTSPVIFVKDSSSLVLTASANANNTLDAELSIGPVAIFVDNGTVKLSEQIGNTNPARFAVGLPPSPGTGGRIAIGQLPALFANLDDRLTLNAAVNVALPLFGPTLSQPLAGVGGGNNIFTAQLASLGGFFAGTSSPTLYSPDIASVLSGFNFTGGIGSLLTGLDVLLGQLSDLAQGELFGLDLPFVGTSLKGSAPSKLLETIRQKVQLATTTPQSAVTAVRTELINALIAAGIGSPSVTYTAYRADGSVQGTSATSFIPDANTADIRFNITASKNLNATPSIDFDLGIPGLSLDLKNSTNTADANLRIDVDWALNLNFGINLSDGFYIETSAVNEVTANAFVSVPGGTTLGGELGFLRLSATNDTATNTSFLGRNFFGSFFGGGFQANLKAPPANNNKITYAQLTSGDFFGTQDVFDYLLTAKAKLDLDMTLETAYQGANAPVLPKLLADFQMLWDFTQSDSSPQPNQNATQLAFNNVRMDLGTFLQRQAGPLITRLYESLEPLRPAITIFNTALPVVNDLGPLRDYVDGQGNNDGKATLRDLAAGFADIPTTALKFLDAAAQIDSLYALLSGFTTTSAPTLSLGSYNINVAGGAASLVQSSAPANIDTQLAGVAGNVGANARAIRGSQAAWGGFGEGSLSFPLFDNPMSAVDLLVGKDVALAQVNFPKLEFGFSLEYSFPIYPLVTVDVVAGMSGFADFGVGYDTRGLRQFKDSGYSDAARLANGFYLRDKKDIGGVLTDVPEMGIRGSLDLFASLNAYFVKLSVGGGVAAEINADLHDPNDDGRINLDELASLYPYKMFDMYGKVTAALKAKASIGFWPFKKTYKKTIAEVTLVDFNSYTGPAPATLSGGTLTFNTTQEDDTFVLRKTGGNATSDNILVMGNGATKEYTGVQRIVFHGQGGDDRITFTTEEKDTNGDGVIDERIAITRPATLTGGAGNDKLTGGDGADSIDGGDGDDEIGGNWGNDTILTGMGNDVVDAGNGNDSVLLGDGHDQADGGLGIDTLRGDAGDDTLAGGGDADSLDGGAGNDELTGDEPSDSLEPIPTGNDTLLGGDDDDELESGPGNDSLLGGNGNDTLGAGDGADTVDGGAGIDCIAGNAGNDSLLGGTDNDLIYGHSGQASDAGADDDRIFANAGNDTVLAGLGNDCVEGGLGADSIQGEAGNDTLIGGSASGTPVDDSSDFVGGGAGTDLLFGDDASVGAAPGFVIALIGGSGNDTLDAGDADDRLFGQAGSDLLTGGLGNDSVDAGTGADTAFAQAGNDTVLGGDGDDHLQGFSGNDLLIGGNQNDQILGGAGFDTLQGEAGNDDLYGEADPDLLYGGAGNDTAQAGAGTDTVIGGGGLDQLYGFSRNDSLDDGAPDLIYGGYALGHPLSVNDGGVDGADTIAGQGGNDTIFGEEGNDQISAGAGNDSVDAAAGNDLVTGDGGDDTLLAQSGDDVVHGGAGADLILLSTGNDRAFGDAGADTLIGDAGLDLLDGGADNDSILGGDDDDTLLGAAGVDRLLGELGDDQLDAGTGVGDYLDAGAGDDLVIGSIDGADDANPADTIAFGDSILGQVGDDTIRSMGGADTIDGGDGDDSVDAGANNDRILLGAGNDVALAGSGADYVEGAAGADQIWGEAGADTILGQDGGDLLDGGADADSLLGGLGDDDLRAGIGAGNQLFGEAGADILTGSDDGADLLEGGIGDDQLYGMAGNDTVRGQDGADVIDAGAGDDTAEGGAGADILAGGADHDSLYGHSATGAGDDNAIDTLFGDFGTGADDVGAGRDRLFGNGGFDVLLGEGNDDFINDFGSSDTTLFGAGDGATPNNFVPPGATPPPGPLSAPALAQRGPSLPTGPSSHGRWAELAGRSAGGVLGQSVGAADVAIDSLDRRVVTWADTRNGNAEIYVARHDGAGWTQLGGSASFGGISNTAGNSFEPSITLDASNNPIVAWTEGNNIFAARYNGAAWVAMGASLSGGGVSNTGAASSPKLVNTGAGAMILWLDSSSGVTQVYARRFNGTSWVEPAAGSASGGGVSGSPTHVSQLAVATDGTRVAAAWTQTVGADPQILLREFDGSVFAERSGSASGNGASNALHGASSPTLAYSGSTLHLAFVAPLDAALPVNGILARRHEGAGWVESNSINTPVAEVRGQVLAPKLAVGGGAVRLGWIEQRTTADTLGITGAAAFDGSAFANPLPPSAEGYVTTATSLAIAADSTGGVFHAVSEPGGVRAVSENGRVNRVFAAGASTSVQSILDANDLGAGDAILVSGSVAGFIVGSDDAGVAILSDRTTPGVITSAVTIAAADVLLSGLAFNATLTVAGANAVLRANRTTASTALRGANVAATGNTFNATVNVDQASSGVIAGNAFVAPGGTALNITAAFTGIVRGNSVSGSNIGIHVGAPASVGGNDIRGNTTGIRVAGVPVGGAGLESNTVRGNITGILLQPGATVVRQHVSGNTTGISGAGTVGGISFADANVLDNNAIGATLTGTVQFNRFTRNGVAVVAGALTRVQQNQVFDSAGDGIRAAGARVVITHNTVIVAGRAVDAASGASEVEVRNNVLVTSGAHALYVDNAARSGFWSDNNLLFAEPGAQLVHWFVDFDDILDWQQDVARYDLHSQGTTRVNPSATRPRFVGLDNLSAARPIGNIRAASPASDLGQSNVDLGVTRARANLLANPSFEAGSATGWNANGTGSVGTSATTWDGTRYYSTGAGVNGFVEQAINLLAAGFTTTQLDSQDLAALFGARVNIAGATKAVLTFLNASNAAIGAPVEFAGAADSSRWELIGGRARLPSGTRSIRVRFEGAVANTLIDSAFLYVENDNLAPDVGFGGSTPTDTGTTMPRIELRSVDLYTDLILDRPTVVRWDTFGDTSERAVRIDLLQDAAQGAQFLMTLAATAPDTGGFEFRPLDYGLAAGTGGYRIRVSLVGDDIAFDRSTEASRIPETGNAYFVDDGLDTNDEFTPAAVGSNRNTGKLASAPKPQLNSILRIYDTGPGQTINIDTGSYNQFDRALISGVVGIGDDEGVTIQGPTELARIASLNLTSPTTGFDIYDGDAVTIRRLTIANPGIGVYVRNNSVTFTGERLTVVSPSAQGVYLDASASGASLSEMSVSGAGSEGIYSGVYLGALTNATVIGSAAEGVQLDAGVGDITGGLFQGNLLGVYLVQSSAAGVPTISGNRFLNNARNAFIEGSAGGAIHFTGNTIAGHTNATYPGVSLSSVSSLISGNVFSGNAVAVWANRASVANNRIEGSTVVAIDARENAVTGNVIVGGTVGIRMGNFSNGTPVEVIRNNLIYNVTTTGIELNNTLDGAVVENNTLSLAGGNGILVTNSGQNVRLKNNIIAMGGGSAIHVAGNSQTGFQSNHNLFHVTGAGSVGNWQGVARTTLAAWRAATATDGNSFTGDPSFVDPASGDFHVKSQTGSYKGGSLAPVLGAGGLPVAAPGNLSPDAVHSVAIDRGDPASPFANEPVPNGDHVNLGAFGNTAQASLSLAVFVKVTSPDGGEQWPIGQSFPISWISHNSASTVTIELLKAGAPVLTIASGEANDGTYLWTVPASITPGSDYRIRITRADGAILDTSDADFVIAPVTSVYYVNDTSTAGDVFSSAAGTALGDGLSPLTPNLSVKYILDNYDLGPNDVIRIDAGTYLTTIDLVIAADDSGVTIEGPDWTGLPAPLATIDRGNAAADTFVFGGANADHITLRNLGLTGGRNSVRLTANADNYFWTIDRIRSAGNATNNDHIQINAFNGDATIRNSVFISGATSGHDGISINSARTIVEGNTFNDGYVGVSIASGGFGSIVRNNTFLSPRSFGVDVVYEPTDPTGQIQVLNNTVTNLVASNAGAGMSLRAYALAQGNTVSGFTLNGGNATGIVALSRLATLKGNNVTNNRYGIRTAGGRAIENTVTNNLVIGISLEGSTSSPSYAIGNLVSGNPNGIYAGTGGRPSFVFNNLLLNNATAINYVSTLTTDSSYVYNNTVVQSGGRGFYSNSGARNVILRNNLFSMNGGTAFEATTGSTTLVSSDYNLYHTTNGANVGVWQGVPFAGLAAWQNTLLIDADSLSADPLFANPGAGDFTLAAGSPAIDTGDPAATFMGETQSGGRVDIGAYGSTAQAGSSPPQLVQVVNPNGGERLVTGVPRPIAVRGWGLAAQDVVLALDTGGGGTTEWFPDHANNALYSAPWHLHSSTTNPVSLAGTTNPAPASVYQSWSISTSTSALRYQLPVADGAYTLRLHFLENQFSSAGSRVMDIAVNDALLVDNFDIIGSGAALRQAKIIEVPVTATGGEGLALELRDVVGDAVLSAIELVRNNAGGAAVPSVSVDLSNDDATYASLAANVALNRFGRATVPWTPSTATNLARIRVTSDDLPLTDTSDATFIVQPATNTYYINDAVVNASDLYTTAPGNDANDGASPATPLASLSVLLALYDLEPGDTVYIDAGTYNLADRIGIGAADAGVTIRGAGMDRTILNRGLSSSEVIYVNNADNVTISDLALTGGSYAFNAYDGSDSDNLLIERVRAFANNNAGIFINTTNDNAIVRDSVAYGIPGGASTDNQQYGFYIYGTNAQVVGNEAYDNSSAGIEAGNNSTPTNINVMVRGNTVYGNSRGIQIARGATAVNNTIYNNATGINIASIDSSAIGNTLTNNATGISAASGDRDRIESNTISGGATGINASGGFIHDNTISGTSAVGITFAHATLRGNTVSNTPVGIRQSASLGAVHSGNLVYGTTVAGLSVEGGGSNAYDTLQYFNNTFVAATGDAMRITAGDQMVFHNNIFMTLGGTGYGMNVVATSHNIITSDYNLFHIASGKIGRWLNADYTSLDAWSSRVLLDKHSISADPQFANPASGDFSLNPGSPTIDAGHPTLPFGLEPAPNGGRANIGHTGNTPGARVSPSTRAAQVHSPDGRERFEMGQTMTIRYGSYDTNRSFSTVADHRAIALAKSPVGYWALDEASGTTAADLSGNGRTGTYSGALSLSQPGAWVDSASPTFAGGSINVPHDAALSTQSITVGGWIKPDAASTDYAAILMKASGVSPTQWNGGYGLFYKDGNVTFFGVNLLNGEVSAPVPAGEWTHVMGTISYQEGLRLYINGALVEYRAYESAAGSGGSAALTIGRGGTGTAPFSGQLDEMAVYGTALGTADIAQLYATSVAQLSNRSVTLELMREGVASPVATIAAGLPLNGSYNWTIPTDLPLDERYRVRATYSDGVNTATDVSNAPILITNNGTNYYVNDAALAGDQFVSAAGNDANSGKSADRPMSSLQALIDAYDLDAGDIVYVDSGTYTVSVNIKFRSDDSGVSIVGAGRSATLFNRGMTASVNDMATFEMLGATSVRFANLAVTGGYYGLAAWSSVNAANLTVQDASFYANLQAGIYIANGNNAIVQRTIVYGIPGGTNLDDQQQGINLTGNNVLVSDSQAYDNANTGIQVSSDSAVVSGNEIYRNAYGIRIDRINAGTGTVRDNEIYNNTTAGVAAGSNMTLLRNRIYGQLTTNAKGVTITSFGAPNLIDNEIFRNYDGVDFSFHSSSIRGNRIYANSRYGINMGSGSQMTGNILYSNSTALNLNNGSATGDISSNLFYSNTNFGVTATGIAGNGGMLFTGNTIYQDVGDAIRLTSTSGNAKLYGNLIWVNSGHAIYVDAGSQTGFVSDGNLFHAPASGVVGFWAGADRATLADWRSASAKDANSVAGDPAFVDIDGADNLLGYVGGVDRGRDDNFHLRAGSPAIDRGSHAQNSIDGAGETRADDPVTTNAGTPSLKPTLLATSNFAATGTAQNWRGDNSNFTVNFGFTFNYFGSSYTSGVLSTKGKLILGSTWQNLAPNSLDLLTVYPTIAPLWDDIRTDGAAADNIFVNTSVPGQITVRFNATNKADNSDVNFSFTLFNTGAIEFNYGAGNTNLTPTIGLSGGYNRPLYGLSPHDGMSTLTNANTVRFDFAPSFNDIGAHEFLGRSDDGVRPTVTGSTPTQVHGQGSTTPVSSIVLNLSEPVDALDARSASIYELRGAGADNAFGTADDVLYALDPDYVSLSTSLTLDIVDGALPNGLYRLTIRGSAAGNSGLHDLAGNVLDGTGAGGGDYTRIFTVSGDSVAPTVTGAFRVDSPSPFVELGFSEDIGSSLTIADVVLQNLTTGAVIPAAQLSITYDPITHRAAVTYLGTANHVLPDGRYRLTLAAGSVADLAGNPLAAAFVLNFTSLGGDTNGNGVVDFDDLLTFAQNYGQSGRTYSEGDFNYDGVVNFDDLLILAQRYGSALSLATPRNAPAALSRGAGKLPRVKGLPVLDLVATPVIDRPNARPRGK